MFIRLPALFLSLLAHGLLLGLSALWLTDGATLEGAKIMRVLQLELPKQNVYLQPAAEPRPAPAVAQPEPHPESRVLPEGSVAVNAEPNTAVPLVKQSESTTLVTKENPLANPAVDNKSGLSSATESEPLNPGKTELRPEALQQASAPKKATASAAPDRSAEPPTRVASEPATSEIADSDLLQRYRAQIVGTIESHKTYPRSARRRGLQGTVVVGFTVHQNGGLSGVEIRQSSGYPRLDRAPLNTLARIERFDPIPGALQTSELRFEVPLIYQLQ